MLDMLPDVFEWPVAVDNWEVDYGWAFILYLPTITLNMSFIAFFSPSPYCPFISSGITWRLEDVIARLNEKYGTQLLVNFFVGTDDRDSTSHIIHVRLKYDPLTINSLY